jgi:hypothetical protein
MVGAVVDGHPVGGGGLHRLDLPGDGAIGGPPLLHQRGIGVGAGEPNRGHVQVQPGHVHPAGRGGGQRQLAAHPLGHRGQRLQRATEPVVVEQSMPGTPSSSATAALDAQPATSYSGGGPS